MGIAIEENEKLPSEKKTDIAWILSILELPEGLSLWREESCEQAGRSYMCDFLLGGRNQNGLDVFAHWFPH